MADNEQNVTESIIKPLGLTQLVPTVYQDALQPAAKEVGKGVETIAKSINIALAPLSTIVWCFDKIKDFIELSLEAKLEKYKERIITPSLQIAGPVLESLKFTAQEPEIREMFTNLLASAMLDFAESRTHPAFVEIIRQMSPRDAQCLKIISEVAYDNLICKSEEIPSDGPTPTEEETEDVFARFFVTHGLTKASSERVYNNLVRLKLIQSNVATSAEAVYISAEENSDRWRVGNPSVKMNFSYSISIETTGLGSDFIHTCVNEP